MKKEDFINNMKVFLYYNNSYYNKKLSFEERIIEAKVKSVGRKYLTVEFEKDGLKVDIQFIISDYFKQNWGYSEYILYINREDIFSDRDKMYTLESIRLNLLNDVDYKMFELKELMSIKTMIETVLERNKHD